jgi:hypothetical protein
MLYVLPCTALAWYGITSSAGKKSFVAGFSANTNNEAVVVLSKLCIENSNNECRT